MSWWKAAGGQGCSSGRGGGIKLNKQHKHPVGVYISHRSTSSSPMKPACSQKREAERKALAQQLWPWLLGLQWKALEQSKWPACRPSSSYGYWTGERSILGLTDGLNPEMCGRHLVKHGGGTRSSPQRVQSAPSELVSMPTAVLGLGSSSILHPSKVCPSPELKIPPKALPESQRL